MWLEKSVDNGTTWTYVKGTRATGYKKGSGQSPVTIHFNAGLSIVVAAATERFRVQYLHWYQADVDMTEILSGDLVVSQL